MSTTTKQGAHAPNTSNREALAAAVAGLGLVSSWGASSAFANNATLTLTGTTGASLAQAISFFTDNSTITVDPPISAVGGAWGDLGADILNASLLAPVGAPGTAFRGYSFAGTTPGSDGRSDDLVLGFAGDGAAAIGVPWTSIFVDNIPADEQVFEPQVLSQLNSTPVFQDGRVEPGSQLDRLDRYYRDLLTADFGESLTLIAFGGPGNTGSVVGTITVVPAPASALLIAAGVIPLARRRRG